MKSNSTNVNETEVNEDVHMDMDNYNLNDNYFDDTDYDRNEINCNEDNIEIHEDELYEEPNFNDSIFNDQFLFEDGLLISKGNNSVASEVQLNEPLFEGSKSTLKDFCRYMLILKISQNLGDVTFTIIVGSILAFLPERNGLRKFIHENPTMYDINKAITTLSDVTDCCRVFKFKVCDNGTCIKKKVNDDMQTNDCVHPNVLNQHFHYLPIRDRIWKLLHSDVRRLFHSFSYITDLEGKEVVSNSTFSFYIFIVIT